MTGLLPADLRDTAQQWPVEGSRRPYDGSFVQVREDEVRTPDGALVTRTVLEHPGAVGVVALDDADRVLLLRQYRHPVGRRLLEVPAGILDVAGEPAVDAAARELAEEAGVSAREWSPLLELWSSPGVSNEHWQVFLARGLTVLSVAERGDLTPAQHEEADLEIVWAPLDEAVRAVLAGQLCDSMAVAGILAAAVARAGH
ncbi:MAG: NUDIX hydrolase [Nocardioidaceae bacterium]|nr:NUDIX hydrolase [Nocardioidaceae bacterium]